MFTKLKLERKNSFQETLTKEESQEQQPAEYYQYKLKGVIVHDGTAEGGHYYSLINTIRDGKKRKIYEQDIWLEFNDQNVKDWSIYSLDGECFGGAAYG